MLKSLAYVFCIFLEQCTTFVYMFVCATYELVWRTENIIFSTHWFPVHLVFFFDNFSVDPTDIIVRIVILAIAIVAVAARTATFCTRFIV